MKKLFPIIVISILIALNVQSQEQEEDYKIIPPSPTAYELGKYGQIPVGYFTGTANVSVPLYNFKAGKLSVPISISYNSNGIKVDQLSSNVGLGWSLNAGGVITRIIKDEPDEESYQFYPENEIQENGIFSPMAMDFYSKGSQEGVDTEADLFMFNFIGYSGKFVYDNNKEIIMMPHQNIRIIPIYDVGVDTGYTIITADGIKYIFSQTERTKSFTQNLGRDGDFSIPQITAWYLSKIIHPGGDQVNFIYENQGYSYTNSISQSHTKTTTNNSCAGGLTCASQNEIKTILNKSTIMGGKKLVEINSNNPLNGKIVIDYDQSHPEISSYSLISEISIENVDNGTEDSFSFNYLTTSNNRIFLENITFLDPSKHYNFDYFDPDGLCERNSFSQDYWGYFNNKTNNYFIPKITTHAAFLDSPFNGDRNPNHQYSKKGLLEKITYPTGGYSEFEYEANSYLGEQTIYPAKENFDFTFTSCNNCYGWSHDTMFTNQVMFDHDVGINLSCSISGEGDMCDDTIISRAADFTFYNENWEEISLLKWSGQLGEWIGTDNPIRLYPGEVINSSDLKTHFDEGSVYAVMLSVNGPCTKAWTQFYYYDEDIQIIPANIETGGSRIKSISAYEPISGDTTETYYYYNEIGKIDTSSGDAGNKGFYISDQITRLDCGYPFNTYVDCEYYVLNSSSLIPLINTGNNNIYYKAVTVSHGGSNFEQGAETHKFTIMRDDPGYDLFQNGYVPTWSNTGWKNGLENSVDYYKKAGAELVLEKRVSNTYKADPRKQDTGYSYNIRKIYDLGYNGPFTYTCKQEDLTYYRDFISCTANHTHSFFYWNGSSTKCKAPGNQMDTLRIRHMCYGLTVDTVLSIRKMVENLRIVEYKNLSFWHYLKTESTTEYKDDGTAISYSTNYYYDDSVYTNLTRVQSTNSKGETIETTTSYPDDFQNNPGNVYMTQAAIDSMLSWHMTGVPIRTEKFIDDEKTEGQITSYSLENNESMVLPSTVRNLEGSNYNVKANYDKYDNHGNPVEFHKEDNIYTTYLWGYNFTYPVAKFENAEFDDVEDVIESLGVSYADLQNKNSIELKSLFQEIIALSSVPGHLLYNTMIYSYTYDPLVGMTSETTPNGKTLTYDYDNFNRLETILDQNGNVLKHYEYNYYEEE